jgi:hypothetical protein
MARPSLITQYMNAPLPCVSVQKRLPYRPTLDEANRLYRSLNKHIFHNALTRPEIHLGTLRKTWGLCHWQDNIQKHGSHGKPGTWCSISLMDKWFCPQWFCTTLAHEMVHQYQWDIERFDNRGFAIHDDSGAHGPSFFAWRERFSYWEIDLKTAHGMRRWFKYQDFHKC